MYVSRGGIYVSTFVREYVYGFLRIKFGSNTTLQLCVYKDLSPSTIDMQYYTMVYIQICLFWLLFIFISRVSILSFVIILIYLINRSSTTRKKGFKENPTSGRNLKWLYSTVHFNIDVWKLMKLYQFALSIRVAGWQFNYCILPIPPLSFLEWLRLYIQST